MDHFVSRRNFLTTGIATAAWALAPAFGETQDLTALTLRKASELQTATRTQMIRSNEIKPDVYAQARRQVDLVRREIKKVFLNVDLVITPTMKTPPGTITAALNPPAPPPPNPAATGNATRNAGGAGLNSVGAFDVYGLPAITVPCGFTSSGLPIGLQISAAPFAEQATEWHTKRPALRSV
jgi:aspartyl-tRNA(Asn)/glutamyl-tRNA(Gln) amidotransferase subunit A